MSSSVLREVHRSSLVHAQPFFTQCYHRKFGCRKNPAAKNTILAREPVPGMRIAASSVTSSIEVFSGEMRRKSPGFENCPAGLWLDLRIQRPS